MGVKIIKRNRIIIIIIALLLICSACVLAGCDINVTPNNDYLPPLSNDPSDDVNENLEVVVHYDNCGEMTSIVYNRAEPITLNIPKARTGYSFLGWTTDDGAIITGDISFSDSDVSELTVYAVWEVVTYSITYDYNGGIAENQPSGYNIESNDINFKSPDKQGYEFDGWFANEEFEGERIESVKSGSIGDITLHAKWSPISYSIMYDLNGGVGVELGVYTIETPTFELYIPTKERSRFTAWRSENEYGDIVSKIECGSVGNMTLFATWGEPTYYIDYELYGGSGDGYVREYNSDSTDIHLGSQTPRRDGYVFDGWYRAADCDGAPLRIIRAAAAIDYKLFAGWTNKNTTDNIIYELNCIAKDGNSADIEEHMHCYYSAQSINNKSLGEDYTVVSTYRSKPVKTVSGALFRGAENSNIIISSGIKTIGDYAFENARNSIINILGGVESIGKEVFKNASYAIINIPGSVGDALGKSAFENSQYCKITLNEGITRIPEYAFRGAIVENIILPSSVQTLAEFSFADMPYIVGAPYNGVSLTLGGNIKYWGKHIFDNSYISKVNFRSEQDMTPLEQLLSLSYQDNKNVTELFLTPIMLSTSQINGVVSTLYRLILGFDNAKFKIDLNCDKVVNTPNLLGHYERGKDKICVKAKAVEKDRYIIDIKIINTMAHEIRHYFQQLSVMDIINGIPETRIPPQMRASDYDVVLWSMPYIEAPYDKYYHQPVEVDARRCATNVTMFESKHVKCSECP